MIKDSENSILISFIIINYKDKRKIIKLIDSILTKIKHEIEIIIVDVDTPELSNILTRYKNLKIKLVQLPNDPGPSQQHNIGARVANPNVKIYFFLDNDTELKETFDIDYLLEEMEKNKIAVIQPLILSPDGKIQSAGNDIDRLLYSRKRRKPISQSFFYASGAAYLIRKDVFWKIGGYDPTIAMAMDDVDLGFRLRIYGYQPKLVPQLKVIHKSYEKLTLKRVRYLCEGTVRIIFKYYPLSWILIFGSIALITRVIGFMIISINKRQPLYFKECLNGIINSLVDLKIIIKERKKYQYFYKENLKKTLANISRKYHILEKYGRAKSI